MILKEIENAIFNVVVENQAHCLWWNKSLNEVDIDLNLILSNFSVSEEMPFKDVQHGKLSVVCKSAETILIQVINYVEIVLENLKRYPEVDIALSILSVGLNKVHFNLFPKFLILRSRLRSVKSPRKVIQKLRKLFRTDRLFENLRVNGITAASGTLANFCKDCLIINFIHLPRLQTSLFSFFERLCLVVSLSLVTVVLFHII